MTNRYNYISLATPPSTNSPPRPPSVYTTHCLEYERLMRRKGPSAGRDMLESITVDIYHQYHLGSPSPTAIGTGGVRLLKQRWQTRPHSMYNNSQSTRDLLQAVSGYTLGLGGVITVYGLKTSKKIKHK